MIEVGLPPVWAPDSKILILGSFPSVMSRGYFYYGNPQNRFWRVLSELLGESAPLEPDEKRRWLIAHGIALWDIVKTCEIEGSMDSDIRILSRDQINDIKGLLDACGAQKVFCNGAKSFALLRKFFPEISAEQLPSTSPANFRFDRKAWDVVAEALDTE